MVSKGPSGVRAPLAQSRLRQVDGAGAQGLPDLLDAGGSGLSTAFEMPTLLGRDSDDPLALGRWAGVAIDSLKDMQAPPGLDCARLLSAVGRSPP